MLTRRRAVCMIETYQVTKGEEMMKAEQKLKYLLEALEAILAIADSAPQGSAQLRSNLLYDVRELARRILEEVK